MRRRHSARIVPWAAAHDDAKAGTGPKGDASACRLSLRHFAVTVQGVVRMGLALLELSNSRRCMHIMGKVWPRGIQQVTPLRCDGRAGAPSAAI